MGTIKAIMTWLQTVIDGEAVMAGRGYLDSSFVPFASILLGFFGLFLLIYVIRLITKLKSFAFFGG